MANGSKKNGGSKTTASGKKKQSADAACEVSETELCEYLNLSGRYIRELAAAGIVKKTRPGRYDLKKSVRGYMDYKSENERIKPKGLDELKVLREQEGLLIDKLKKRKAELSVMQTEKKLLLSEDVICIWTDFATVIKSKLLNLPVKLSPILSGIEDVGQIKSILMTELTDALNEIAEFDINSFKSDLNFNITDDEDDGSAGQ